MKSRMLMEPLEPFVFNIHELAELANSRRDDYRRALPFPHAVIDDFLPLDYANKILDVFPDQHAPLWLDWKQRDTIHQPLKQGIGHASRLQGVSPHLQNVLTAFPIRPFP